MINIRVKHGDNSQLRCLHANALNFSNSLNFILLNSTVLFIGWKDFAKALIIFLIVNLVNLFKYLYNISIT